MNSSSEQKNMMQMQEDFNLVSYSSAAVALSAWLLHQPRPPVDPKWLCLLRSTRNPSVQTCRAIHSPWDNHKAKCKIIQVPGPSCGSSITVRKGKNQSTAELQQQFYRVSVVKREEVKPVLRLTLNKWDKQNRGRGGGVGGVCAHE